MKSKPRLVLNLRSRFAPAVAATLAVASLVSVHPAQAQSPQTWLNGGVSDNWNLTDANWTPGVTTWGQNNNAIFDTAGEVVTVTDNIVFNDMTFNVSGYTIADGAGSLALGTDNLSVITVAAGQTTTVAETMANNAAAPSTLTKSGTGTLALTGLNTFTGTMEHNAGILNVGTFSDYGVAGSLGARTLAQETNVGNGIGIHIGLGFAGATLQYTGSTAQSTNRQLRLSAATNTIEASGSDPSATLSFTYNGANTNLFDTGGTRTLNLAGTNTGANLFAIRLENQGGSATSLTKNGAGTWVLTGASTYTGATTVSGGVLNIRSANALGGTAGGTTVAANAALEIQGGITTAAEALTINGGGITNQGALRNISGNNTYSGTITVATQARINSDSGTLTLSAPASVNSNNLTLVVGGAGNTTIGGVVALGTGGIAKDGAGTLTLAGLNTFTGVVDMNAGVVNVGTFSDYGVAGGLGARTLAQETSVGSGIGIHIGLGTTGATLQYTGSTAQSTNRQIRLSAATNTIEASGSDPAATLSFTYTGANTNLFDTGGARTLNLAGTNTGANLFAINLENQAANATSLTKSGTGTWVLTGNSTYSGATNINAGVLNIQSATALGGIGGGTVVAANAALEIQGGITTAAEPLTINGGGIGNLGALRNISGDNTYAGPVTVATQARINSDSGTLTLSAPNSVTSNNLTLVVGGAGNVNIAGIVALGTGSVNKADGVGMLTLSGANTYTGATSVTGGTIKAGSAVAFTNKGALALGTGGTFDLNGFNSAFTTVNSSVAGSVITDTGTTPGTSILSFSNLGTTINSLVNDGPTRAVAVTIANPNSGVTPFATANQSTFSGGLTLLTTAAGTRLRISSPVITTGAAGAIVSGPYGRGPITIGQAIADKAQILLDSSNNIALANDIIVNTAQGTDFTGSFRIDSADNIFSGTITANLANAKFNTFFAGSSATVTGQIVGGMGVEKVGPGTLTLSGANTYTGTTTIAEGTLRNGSAGTFTSKGPLAMSGNGIFDLGGFDAAVTNFTGSATTNTITNTGAADAALTVSAMANSPASTINALVTDGPTNRLALRISNNLSGNPILNLGNQNTFSGGFTLLDGPVNGTRLRISSPFTTVGAPGTITSSPFGTGPITIGTAATDRAQILLDGSGNITIANDIVVNTALGTDAAGTFRIDSAGNVLSGTITANLANARFNTNFAAASVNATGQIAGGMGVDKVGPGTAILSGANTYAGPTTVSAGVLNIRSATALGDIAQGTTVANGAALEIQGGITTAAEPLVINTGGINNLGALRNISGDNTYAGPVTLATQARINSDSGTLTLSAPNAVTSNNLTLVVGGAGNVNITGNVALGNNGINKAQGTGTLTLAGTNTYNGPTNVDDGRVLVNGSIAMGLVSVGGSGTLGGSGVIGGNVNINSGGTLAPGSSPGVLTINGNVLFGTGSTYAVEVNGTTVGSQYDQLLLTAGTLSLTGDNNLAVSLGFTPQLTDMFTLADVPGATPISGIFESLNGNTVNLAQGAFLNVGSTSFLISYTAEGGVFAGAGNNLALLVVPEPNRAVLLLAGLPLLMRRRRKTKG